MEHILRLFTHAWLAHHISFATNNKGYTNILQQHLRPPPSSKANGNESLATKGNATPHVRSTARDYTLFQSLTSKEILAEVEEDEVYTKAFGKHGLVVFLQQAETNDLVIHKMCDFLSSLKEGKKKVFLSAMSDNDIVTICKSGPNILQVFLKSVGSLALQRIIKHISSSGYCPDSECQSVLLLCVTEKEKNLTQLFNDKEIYHLMQMGVSFLTSQKLMLSSKDIESIQRVLPFSYCTNGNGIWSAKAFCPVLSMTTECEHNPQAKRSIANFLDNQMMEMSLLLRNKVSRHSDHLELNLSLENLRCRLLPLQKRQVGENIMYFMSKVAIKIEPHYRDKEHIYSFKVEKSSDDIPVTIYRQQKVSRRFSRNKSGYTNMKMSKIKESSSISCSNWRFEQYEGEPNVGFMDWTLYDVNSGHVVWPGDFLSTKRNRPSAPAPFNSMAGCVFSDDKYPQALSWRLSEHMVGRKSSWNVSVRVWLTCHSSSYFHSTAHTFSHSLDLAF